MASGKQVQNGKAFEFALATQYFEYLNHKGIRTEVQEESAYENAKRCFYGLPETEQKRFCIAALKTIDTIVRLEPGLIAPKNADDVLSISLLTDAEGQKGDVRDVVFSRQSSRWEVGFSAKNNHEAVKHSRLSDVNDFGKNWLGVKCSQRYWDEVLPVFNELSDLRKEGKQWKDMPQSVKWSKVYTPVLLAFKRELMKIYEENDGIAQKLIRYCVGNHSFYKVIKDDTHNLVIVKAFNLGKQLNRTVNGKSADYRTPNLRFPTRIVEFEMKKNSQTTLNMILDEGWELSFRLHNGDGLLTPSLKFDIQLIGNPPILFTQHLFQ